MLTVATVAAAAASGCRYKVDIESGAIVVVGKYSIIELCIRVAIRSPVDLTYSTTTTHSSLMYEACAQSDLLSRPLLKTRTVFTCSRLPNTFQMEKLKQRYCGNKDCEADCVVCVTTGIQNEDSIVKPIIDMAEFQGRVTRLNRAEN